MERIVGFPLFWLKTSKYYSYQIWEAKINGRKDIQKTVIPPCFKAGKEIGGTLGIIHSWERNLLAVYIYTSQGGSHDNDTEMMCIKNSWSFSHSVMATTLAFLVYSAETPIYLQFIPACKKPGGKGLKMFKEFINGHIYLLFLPNWRNSR